MRRNLFLLAAGLLALTAGLPGRADAAVSEGGTLTSGQAVAATVAAGEDVAYSFEAGAGRHVTFDVTSFGLRDGAAAGAAYLRFYPPGSTEESRDCYVTASDFCDFTPAVGGPWRVVLDPVGAAAGSARFVFAEDVAAGGLASGVAVKTKLAVRGQNAVFTFWVNTGKHVAFDLTDYALTNGATAGSATLRFFAPGSATEFANCSFTASGFCDITATVEGAWTAVLDGVGGSKGKVTVTAAKDGAAKALTPGVAVTNTLTTRGQNALYTFKATAGQHVTFDISNVELVGHGTTSGAYLRFVPPGATAPVSSCYFFRSDFCELTPAVSGTWHVVLDGYLATTGSVRTTLAENVPSVALKSGTPVRTTLAYRGQNALYTFKAVAGQHVTFDVTNSTLLSNSTTGAVTLRFYPPGSSTQNRTCDITGTGGYCDFVPAVGGTWKVAADGYDASIGAFTTTFANDVAATAVPNGTPVQRVYDVRGQNAEYTLAVTAGQPLRFAVSELGLTNGAAAGAVNIRFYAPGATDEYTDCYFTQITYCEPELPITGTWRVLVDPVAASTGPLTFTRS